jgi:hypothetical protein
VGPWLLAPSLTAGWSNDSNVFYRSEQDRPSGDNILRVIPQIRAQLPFRNSALELAYRRTFLDYRKTRLDGSGFHELEGALRLRFSTHDTLELTGAHTRGRAEFLRFDAGELVFQGEPYRLNAWGLRVFREVPGHRGYALSVLRSDLNFSEDVEVQFFDFRSLAVEVEYREPLGPNSWILSSLQLEDADHFCRFATATGAPCPGVGVPFRRARGGTAMFGLRGVLGGQEPFYLRVGREVRRFEPQDRVTSGLVGEGLLTLRLAPSSRILVTAHRRTWPSFYQFNDFYRSQDVEVRFERAGKTRTNLGGSVGLQWTQYPLPDASGAVRRDRRIRGEAYATLLARDRAGIRVSAARHRRSSNIERLDYEGTVLFAGIVLGWF